MKKFRAQTMTPDSSFWTATIQSKIEKYNDEVIICWQDIFIDLLDVNVFLLSGLDNGLRFTWMS